MTYAELEQNVATLAGHLRRAGFVSGDRVATWLPKTILACLMPLATARAGLVHIPINPRLRRKQVLHILDDCGASLLLTNTSFARSLRQEDLTNRVHWIAEELTWRGDPIAAGKTDPETLAAILYTSGSTGQPKGVMLSHANLWLGAASVTDCLNLSAVDRVLAVLPLSFDYGQNQLLSTWYAGGCVFALEYLLPRDVFRAIRQHRITTLAGVPPLFTQLTEMDWREDPVCTVIRVTNSGGALTPQLIERIRKTLNPVRIYAMYGLTEAFRSTTLDPALLADFPTSIGSAVPFAEILVVRPDGSLVHDGEAGELVHAGPLVAKGYWNNAEATRGKFRPAPPSSKSGGTAVWTGDVVRLKAGLLYFVGRRDEAIKSSGYRISPGEIEEVAMASGEALEAVAFGIFDERLGEAIVLVVRLATPGQASLARLARFLGCELPSFMLPGRIVEVNSIPRGPNGKIDRVGLKETWTR